MKFCDLYERNTIKSGKDTFIYEADGFYVFENGNTHLSVNGKLRYAKRRITLATTGHKSSLSPSEMELAKSKLSYVLGEILNYSPDEYFFRITMGTYPEHFHMHAYIPPFSDNGKII